MKVNVVNGFSDQPDGGNPAGVVYLGSEVIDSGSQVRGLSLANEHAPFDECMTLPEEEMQRIAAELHFSETAFITRLGEKRFAIRYFTPAAEVPLCGHATIASFSYLYQKGVIGDGTYQLVTKEAQLSVEISDGIVWMEMDKPQMEQELDSRIVNRICAAYEISPSDLDEKLEVRIVKSGLRDIHVCVNDREVLLGAVQHEEEVSRLSKELDVVGVHMSSVNSECRLQEEGKSGLDVDSKDSGKECDSKPDQVTAYCSNYAPLYEIPEECATGTSNGGLTFYLYQKGLIPPEKVNCFLQGEHMNRPSKVYTKVRLEGGVPTVWVGGRGVICEEDIYTI